MNKKLIIEHKKCKRLNTKQIINVLFSTCCPSFWVCVFLSYVLSWSGDLFLAFCFVRAVICAIFPREMGDSGICSGLRFSFVKCLSCCGSGCVQFHFSDLFYLLLIVLFILLLFPACWLLLLSEVLVLIAGLCLASFCYSGCFLASCCIFRFLFLLFFWLFWLAFLLWLFVFVLFVFMGGGVLLSFCVNCFLVVVVVVVIHSCCCSCLTCFFGHDTWNSLKALNKYGVSDIFDTEIWQLGKVKLNYWPSLMFKYLPSFSASSWGGGVHGQDF